MPELPEVESVVRTLRPRLVGRRIVDFQSLWPRQVSPGFARVRDALIGREVLEVVRRGKYIAWRLADGYLLIHLRMSGRLEWGTRDAAPRTAHVRAVWELTKRRPGSAIAHRTDSTSAQAAGVRAKPIAGESGADGGRFGSVAATDELWFLDARKFGRIRWVRDLADLDDELGVEPLSREFSTARLAELLKGRKRAIKPLLLDQTRIAGLGNIYVDEALFRAGVHPLASADRLRGKRIDRLHAAIRAVLREAIRRNGTSIDWIYPGGEMQDHLRVYGRTDEPCGACGAPIRRIVVGQRGTHFCPRCQRK